MILEIPLKSFCLNRIEYFLHFHNHSISSVILQHIHKLPKSHENFESLTPHRAKNCKILNL